MVHATPHVGYPLGMASEGVNNLRVIIVCHSPAQCVACVGALFCNNMLSWVHSMYLLLVVEAQGGLLGWHVAWALPIGWHVVRVLPVSVLEFVRWQQ